MRLLSRFLRASLPSGIFRSLRRFRYAYLIRHQKFRSPEKEYEVIGRLVSEGETVVDVGANVGHYTLRFADLVGPRGRVVAFEPVLTTFELLTSNVVCAAAWNVTLVNAAVTQQAGPLGFTIPQGNTYQAHAANTDDFYVFGLRLDAVLDQQMTLGLIKVDAEGADAAVIRSAVSLIERHRPFLMVELTGERAAELAEQFTSYEVRKLQGSHNSILYPSETRHTITAAIEQ